MDKKKLLLLKLFLNRCDGGYKVIELSHILTSIKKYKGNVAQLTRDINYLSQYKYIDVKYLDDINVCLSILDNSHVFQENMRSDRAINKKYLTSLILTSIFSGIMAFVGAFLAIMILR